VPHSRTNEFWLTRQPAPDASPVQLPGGKRGSLMPAPLSPLPVIGGGGGLTMPPGVSVAPTSGGVTPAPTTPADPTIYDGGTGVVPSSFPGGVDQGTADAAGGGHPAGGISPLMLGLGLLGLVLLVRR
jgi:hypothetical protein